RGWGPGGPGGRGPRVPGAGANRAGRGKLEGLERPDLRGVILSPVRRKSTGIRETFLEVWGGRLGVSRSPRRRGEREAPSRPGEFLFPRARGGGGLGAAASRGGFPPGRPAGAWPRFPSTHDRHGPQRDGPG